MAVGTILTVLSNIPWGTVVENAPKIADGAARLWNTVARRKPSGAADNAVADAPVAKPRSEVERLAARLQTAEEGVARLEEQMQASSELIKALAEQNSLLIQRIELNRQRLVRLVAAGAGVAVVLLGFNLYLLYLR